MKTRKVALLSIIFMSLMVCWNVNAGQFKAKECEYSDEYIRWMNLSDEEKEGLIVPNMCKIESSVYDKGTADASSARFNLAESGKVLGVRNQQSSESCWAYSTAASIESNLLMQGKTVSYLSPSHIEVLTQNTYKVPNIESYVRNFNGGGSGLVSGAYVLNHWGPVLETDYPETNTFNAITNKSLDTSSILVGAKYDVDNVTFLGDMEQGKCSANAITSIKNYIATNGAVLAQMFWAPITTTYTDASASKGAYVAGDYLVGPYYYYDGSTATYATTSVGANSLSNHGVTIVGWDDTIDASKFVLSGGTKTIGKQPTRNGAWIIKNSYGSTYTANGKEYSLGNDGYFYVSYDDINICSLTVGFNGVNESVSNNAYYYDYMNYNNALMLNANTYYVANKFTKKSSGNEVIEKVSFMSAGAGISYSVYINNTDHLVASGTTKTLGYESVILDSSYVVDKDFAVIVKFNSNVVPVSARTEENQYVITPNVSFISADGVSFDALSTSTAILQANVRAYTNNTTQAASDLGSIFNASGSTIDVSTDNPTSVITSNPKTGVEDHKEVLLIAVAGIVLALYVTKNTKFRRI